MLTSCSKCGKPESCIYDSDTFCGSCEGEYQAENFRLKEEEKAILQVEMADCACYGDEPCQNCYLRLARLMELDGRHEEAVYWLNH